MIEKSEKFKACLLLASFGDTLGFNNGMWEFNYGFDNPGPQISSLILWEFISLGGINNINMKNWDASDDTILQIATTNALINDFNTMTKLKKNFIEEYLKSLNDLLDEKRAAGKTTINSLKILKKSKDINDITYNKYSGGNGAAMRSMAIGLAFNGKENRKKLITASIDSALVTHNNAIGIMGSIVTALFTSFGIEGINPIKWCEKLIKIMDSDIIDNIMKVRDDFNQFLKDKNDYIDKWKIYHEVFKKRNRGEFLNPYSRTEFYEKHFSSHINYKKIKDYSKMGASGLDSVIIAYDSILHSILIGNNEAREAVRMADKLNKIKDLKDTFISWETLVIYSMLHVGDNDTTGTIAAAWFGAYQGFNGVPKNNMENLEFEKQILDISKKLYEKFK